MRLTPPQRLTAWKAVAVASPVATLAWLALSHGRPADTTVIAGWLVCGAIVLAMAALLITTPPDAITLPRRTSERLILGVALLLQIAAVLLPAPTLSDDILRYRIDGRTWLAGETPYATPPAAFITNHTADQGDRAVPYGQLHTIYPPTAQLGFTLLRAVEDALCGPITTPLPDGWRATAADLPLRHRALPWRVFSAAGIIATSGLLLVALRQSDRSAWWAALFAWSPLVVAEGGWNPHCDAPAAALLVGALLAHRGLRPMLAAALLALATGVKPPAILVLPALLFPLRTAWRPALAFAAVSALLWLPPMLYRDGYAGFSATADLYARAWEANGSVYELLTRPFRSGPGMYTDWAVAVWTRRLLHAVLAGGAIALLARGARGATYATAVLMLALLLSPVVYPWYLLWPLAAAALCPRPTLAPFVWAATVGLSYLVFRTTDWRLPVPVLLAEYLPVYAAVAWDLRRRAP